MRQQVQLWPYLLRWDDFESARTAFEKARSEVAAESEKTGKVPVKNIQNLHEKLMVLTNEFHRSTKAKQYCKQNNRFTHFIQSDRFLRELDREITRLEKTGDISPFRGKHGFDPKQEGDHVIGLLCYMNRNGIEFAPPEPGSEYAYHNLFVMMRAIYLTVAEIDESTKPLNLGEMAK